MEIPFKLRESTLFFSFLRMVIVSSEPNSGIRSLKILPKVSGYWHLPVPEQKFVLENDDAGVIEAMIDRSVFPAAYDIEIFSDRGGHRLSCSDLVEFERREHARSSFEDFRGEVEAWRLMRPGATPRVLDIGGRARSGFLLADHIENCEVSVLDIVPDHGVDIVADIHDMSAELSEGRFDFLICVSVFEHLVMPWKAAIEINRVLAHGGLAFIQTHQTVGMHDIPWDYFRFSDQSWKGLFNEATGFEVVRTFMSNFVRITPMRIFNIEPGSENAGGFYESSVVVRKTGSTALRWPVGLAAIVDTIYPG